MVQLHKYSGAGNTFVVLDGRTEDVSAFRTPEHISFYCKKFGTDGLMILTDTGEILRCAQDDNAKVGGGCKTVRLRMIDVHEFHPALDGWFLDTGTRHFVRFVPDVEAVDIEEEGRRARWDPVFAPIGANANFVSVDAGGVLHVRTFEKGVEGETLACGTGITASAIAAFLCHPERSEGSVHYDIQARIARLAVDFVPGDGCFTDVYLTGPAEEMTRDAC